MMLDKFEPSSDNIVKAMFDLASIKPGEVHLDLGSGDGRFLVEAQKRGATSIGYEVDKGLVDECLKNGLNVINDDCFNADVSKADVITCYFSLLPQTTSLMDKLFSEMKTGARLVKQAYTPHTWKPQKNIGTSYSKETFQNEKVLRVDGNIICLYIK